MFKNTFQSGFLSILYSLVYVAWWPCIGLTSYNAFFSLVWIPHVLCFSLCYLARTKPLQIWDKEGESVMPGVL